MEFDFQTVCMGFFPFSSLLRKMHYYIKIISTHKQVCYGPLGVRFCITEEGKFEERLDCIHRKSWGSGAGQCGCRGESCRDITDSHQ